MKPRLNLVRLFALGMTGLTWAGISDAAALDYPTRPVRWVVGYPAGGTTDILARLIGQYLSEKLGQQFIVENKPGAGNNIATEAVINSPPDGYTLLFVNPANGINASLYKKLSFNFVRDIAPVAGITRVPNVMEVNPNVPAKTVAEFIAYAKANPNKVNLASSGNGTSVHLSGELFMAMTGVKLTHVPYRGSAPALTDMIAGQVQVLFDNLPSSIEHVRARQAARTRGDHREALGCAAGRADRGGDRAGLRGERVVRHGRAQGHSAGGHRGAQQGDQRGACRPEHQGAARRNRRHADGRHAGGLRQDHRRETEKWRKVVEFAGASVD